jgi:hypothetical protein
LSVFAHDLFTAPVVCSCLSIEVSQRNFEIMLCYIVDCFLKLLVEGVFFIIIHSFRRGIKLTVAMTNLVCSHKVMMRLLTGLLDITDLIVRAFRMNPIPPTSVSAPEKKTVLLFAIQIGITMPACSEG